MGVLILARGAWLPRAGGLTDNQAKFNDVIGVWWCVYPQFCMGDRGTAAIWVFESWRPNPFVHTTSESLRDKTHTV